MNWNGHRRAGCALLQDRYIVNATNYNTSSANDVSFWVKVLGRTWAQI